MCFASCKSFCQEDRQASDRGGTTATHGSQHTCTDVKSPEAQAPRIAAPTRTDSTSCDRTTGMPAQDKVTPWLVSRTRAGGSQQVPPRGKTPDVKSCNTFTSLKSSVSWGIESRGFLCLVPAGILAKSLKEANTTSINLWDLGTQVFGFWQLYLTLFRVSSSTLLHALLGPVEAEMNQAVIQVSDAVTDLDHGRAGSLTHMYSSPGLPISQTNS